MRHPLSDAHAPRLALFGALAVAGFAVIATGLARVSGVVPDRLPEAEVVVSRDLRFDDRADGAVTVQEPSGSEVAVISPGTNGFLRGVMRGLARERLRRDIGSEPPFRLVRWSDGRLSLEDPETGHRIDLASFGLTNAQAFGRLLPTERSTP